MIAIGILTTWLTLTAAGFAGLSALGRIGAREDVQARRTPHRRASTRAGRRADPDPEGAAAMSPIVSAPYP